MRIAYFDCCSGISGDMTLGALIDAGASLAEVQSALDSLQIPGLRLQATEVKKKGFRATHVTVLHEPEHKHRHLHHIEAMIEKSSLTARQRETARAIFHRLSQAEAKVHGTTVEKVHFHEVGAVDSIADILGAAVALDLLNIDKIYCSPTPTGGGMIEIAHGKVGVPAPATAELLQGLPIAPSSVQAELTTPTGAAILAALAEKGSHYPPSMMVEKTGYGAGSMELAEQANILRVLVGEARETDSDLQSPAADVWEIETNLDTVSGEEMAFALEKLWELQPLDVFCTPIQMKKGRPAVRVTILCDESNRSSLEQALFLHTGTLGLRRCKLTRSVLPRRHVTVHTPWGPVEGKVALFETGPVFSPEFDDCRGIAQRHGLTLREVVRQVEDAYRAGGGNDTPA